MSSLDSTTANFGHDSGCGSKSAPERAQAPGFEPQQNSMRDLVSTVMSSEPWQRHQILVVDDDPSIVAQLRSELVLEGYCVIGALSGEQALATLEHTPARLVISDVKMDPGMSGTQFLAVVKQRYPDVITMILSAFAEPQDLMDAMNKARAHQYLVKPWQPDDLLDRVCGALKLYQSQQEQRFLAQANLALIQQISRARDRSLIGDFSRTVYARLSPIVDWYQSEASHGRTGAAGQSMDIDRAGHYEPANMPNLVNMAAAIQRLGDFVEIHCDQGEGEAIEHPPVSLVQSCVRAARALVPDVEFREEYDDDTPVLPIYPEAFNIAVKAMIENAVVFGRSNGQLTITVRVLHDKDGARDLVRIEVQDNGPGIPAGDEGKIFVPLHTTCSQDWGPGPFSPLQNIGDYNFRDLYHVGLGLPIAQCCVARHGGTIEATNVSSGGAWFRITLPTPDRDAR